MARKRKVNETKRHIIQIATQMFLENGYTNTSVKAISDRLSISTGNLTFHFPTKEHMLAVLIRMLCDFQWAMMRNAADDKNTLLNAVCMELIAMAAICEENEIVKDFYICAYTHPMTLEIIRRSDTERSKIVYSGFCENWSMEQYIEAETLVSGIEYATLMTTPDVATLETRISGALNAIMMLYHVPEDIRLQTVEKILKINYRALGRQIFSGFLQYIDTVDDQALEQYIIG